MKSLFGISCLLLAAAALLSGCNREKIVENTQYIHDTKYVETPPDTVFRVDTVRTNDSVTIYRTDTVRVTVTVHDTVRTVQNHYDTVRVTDTVVQTQYVPSGVTAVNAMERQTDPLVLAYAQQTYGMTDGWILYSSPLQMDVRQVSNNVFDIAAYVDFWAPDWSGYDALEVAWRMTYSGGDPSNANNWQMSEPPAAVAGHAAGIHPSARTATVQQLAK